MHLVFETIVPVQREIVFRFHECSSCLAVLHHGWSNTRLLKHEARVRVGGEVWAEQMVAGFLPVIVGFRHFLFEPSLRFGEDLFHGPFSRFRHIHEFEDRGSETMVRDVLNVEWPWQYGGQAALHALVVPGIRKMFRTRGEVMLRLAQNGVIAELAARNKNLD
jgi:ligand-binding SRPBCC domain-containing protein